MQCNFYKYSPFAVECFRLNLTSKNTGFDKEEGARTIWLKHEVAKIHMRCDGALALFSITSYSAGENIKSSLVFSKHHFLQETLLNFRLTKKYKKNHGTCWSELTVQLAGQWVFSSSGGIQLANALHKNPLSDLPEQFFCCPIATLIQDQSEGKKVGCLWRKDKI